MIINAPHTDPRGCIHAVPVHRHFPMQSRAPASWDWELGASKSESSDTCAPAFATLHFAKFLKTHDRKCAKETDIRQPIQQQLHMKLEYLIKFCMDKKKIFF